MKRRKTPKVKIDRTELKSFSYESLVIDSYWEDLYNPKEKRPNHIYNGKYQKRTTVI